MKIHKALSKGEEEFYMHCQAYNLDVVREYEFAPGKKYRADFAFLRDRVIVEIEGGTRMNGRHNRHDGFEKDCRKYNLAALGEWLVFRFTSEMVHSGEAIDTVRKALACP